MGVPRVNSQQSYVSIHSVVPSLPQTADRSSPTPITWVMSSPHGHRHSGAPHVNAISVCRHYAPSNHIPNRLNACSSSQLCSVLSISRGYYLILRLIMLCHKYGMKTIHLNKLPTDRNTQPHKDVRRQMTSEYHSLNGGC